MKEWELKVISIKCVNKSFKMKPLSEYESEFKREAKQILLFHDNEFSEYETCFCGR
ncbi:hypothetical protein [Helicobacter bilis]|uniref:hypothetical protein n=1 Tax=Helicobacter bilis TaxID=37372 RepID=UPI00248F3F31|nr:hypothetical protein [Helicobacter bilis]